MLALVSNPNLTAEFRFNSGMEVEEYNVWADFEKPIGFSEIAPFVIFSPAMGSLAK